MGNKRKGQLTTDSERHKHYRQNILKNRFVVDEIQNYVGIEGFTLKDMR